MVDEREANRLEAELSEMWRGNVAVGMGTGRNVESK